MEELEREAEQHLQEVTAQLREAQKEADGDLLQVLLCFALKLLHLPLG